MKYIFLSIALVTTICSLAQAPAQDEASRRLTEMNRTLNRASEWSKQSALETIKIDSSKLVKKTITQEIALPKALDVLIDMSGELIIHTWNDNKMKIETTVQFEESSELTDAQWFEKIGINMKIFGSTVKVKSRTSTGIAYFNSWATTYSSSAPVYYYNGSNYFNMQRGPVTLYIPAESILEIESRSGRLKIRNNIKSLLLDNSDGEIEFANIEKLQIRSNRGSFTGGVVAEADIELSHGRFTLKQLNKGIVKSSYSTIEIESLKDVKLNSSNDEMDIDNVSALYGIKNYGNLRINQLTGKLDLQGINSDIKLRHIDPSAQLVKIINRNADLRLSATNLSNFSVDIKGSYNTIYSSFAENTTVDTLTTEEIESVKTMTNAANPTTNALTITGTTNNLYATGRAVAANSSPFTTVTGYGITANKQTPWLKYTAKMGTGNNLKYQVICTSCVIDFK